MFFIPYVNKYAKYPIKEPTMITGDFKHIEQYFGIAEVKILPPRKLYHPVLPVGINGKLLFPLSRTCASKQSQDTCDCSDEDRSLVGTWCTPEIMKSQERGYTVLKIYEIYHWDQTSQSTDYINMFLKLKQDLFGWLVWG